MEPSRGPKNTWKFQSSLPRLPVAPLRPTLDKYLLTVRPLVTDEQFENTKRLVEDFAQPGGLGEKLHKLLEERAKKSKTHWLEEWWDFYAYFAPRDPIAVNVNYFFYFDVFKPNQLTQSRRAAHLIAGALEFRRLLISEELEPDENKGKPQDMSAFHWMFDTCRIPRLGSDYLKKYTPDEAKHVVVAWKNHFYVFDVIVNGKFLSVDQLERQLNTLLNQSAQVGKGVPLGVLTADNRDNWARVRDKVVANRTNVASLEKLQSAVFMVCLDDTSPQNADEMGRALWHGDGSNRWFDKSVQFIVFPDGTCGLNGEHSKLDGLPSLRMADFVVNFKPKANSFEVVVPEPERLQLEFSREILRDIEESAQNFDKFVGQFEIVSFNYQKYGAKFIKQHKMSPDAYFQIAINWTYFRIFGHLCAAYESASTKKFMNGRTEVGRSASLPVLEWAQSMASPQKTIKEKQQLLKAACDHHAKYMQQACDGMGVDRLLLGLRLIGQENGFEKHPIFTDPSYLKSVHWNLSTSQLSSSNMYVGFGPVVLDGFGICYCLRNDSINSFISSMTWHPLTRSKKFQAELTKTFDLMAAVLEAKTTASL